MKIDINNTEKKTPGPAGFSGGAPVSISLIPEGFMAKIHFTKNRKNRKFSENRKIQPHVPFKRTTAGGNLKANEAIGPTTQGTPSKRLYRYSGLGVIKQASATV